MNNIYKQLARVLDQIPEGYPATDSGVELKYWLNFLRRKKPNWLAAW